MTTYDVDIDDVAVERAMDGDRNVPLNRAEFAEAWRRLDADGVPRHIIADILGTTTRSLRRWANGIGTPVSRPDARGGRQPFACRKGCGRLSPIPQGRAAHERHCTYRAAA